MSHAYKWVEPPWPQKPLPRAQLEDRIEQLLGSTNMCVLATVGGKGQPIASPIEYYADGLDLYMLPDPGTPKLKAMQRDPRICLAVANPMAGWASAMGCQMFGNAELLDPGTKDWERGMQVFKWPASAFEIGRPFKEPPRGQLMRLRPDRIVYTEHFLRRDGYGPRQIWLREG